MNRRNYGDSLVNLVGLQKQLLPKNPANPALVGCQSWEVQDEEHNINNYKSSESNPEEAYLLKEEIEEFKKFSENNFSKFEKEVLTYLIRGYSYREIAKILSKNLKSIDNTIQRIRKKSEEWIKKEENIKR